MTNYKVRGNELKNNDKSTKLNNMNRTASCYQTNSSVVFESEISNHVKMKRLFSKL